MILGAQIMVAKVDRTTGQSTGRPVVRSTANCPECGDGYAHICVHSIPTHGRDFSSKSRPDGRTKSFGVSGRLFGCFQQVLQYYFLAWGLKHD